MCFLLVFYNLRTNVLDQIAIQKMYGLERIPEVEGGYDAWEWHVGLETFGALNVSYKEEYLDESIKEIGLHFSAFLMRTWQFPVWHWQEVDEII